MVLTRETGWSYTREIRRSSSEEIGRSSIRKFCIQSYTEAFIAAADSSKVATLVRREISALRVGEREYDVRHRRSAEIVARAGHALGTIERVVLPSDGALARELLGELLDAEQQIAEQAYEDDYGAEELFARVRSLLSATAER